MPLAFGLRPSEMPCRRYVRCRAMPNAEIGWREIGPLLRAGNAIGNAHFVAPAAALLPALLAPDNWRSSPARPAPRFQMSLVAVAIEIDGIFEDSSTA